MAARGSKIDRSAKWVLAAPLIAFTALFVVWPVAQGVQTSLYDFTLQNPEITFNGLDNFRKVFSLPGFWDAVRFTALFAVVVTAAETVLGFGLALLMNRAFPGKKLFFTALLLPIMIAPSLLGVMFRLLLNGDIGLAPEVLSGFGLDVALFAPGTVVPLLIVLDVLQWTPFIFLIVYSGLQSFPTDVLEAAQVDGAGRLRTLTSLVIPIMKPVIAAAVFLRMIDAIRTFDVIYVLTAGGPGRMTTTISIYIYKTAFESGDFGLAAAVSTVVLLALLPLVPLVVRHIAQPKGGR